MQYIQKIFTGSLEFEWDEGNFLKNWLKHRVSPTEAEQVFQDAQAIISIDKLHSEQEPRYSVLGFTAKQRLLFVAFTLRVGGVRIISARAVSRKERTLYEEKIDSTKI